MTVEEYHATVSGLKQEKICSHGLTVTCTEDNLEDTFLMWVPNVLKIMQDAVPKSSGKKTRTAENLPLTCGLAT